MTPRRAVYLFVFDGFADWEPAHAVAELRRSGGYRVEVVGTSGAVVESMGGLPVRPTRTLMELDPSDVAIFILPGGEPWEREPVPPAVADALGGLDRAGVPVAAICAATTAVARTGLIRGRRHTSNGLAYLSSRVPGYSEAAAYVDEPAVRDRGLITASGVADVEFAAAIMAELDVLSDEDRALWTEMFRRGRIPDGTLPAG